MSLARRGHRRSFALALAAVMLAGACGATPAGTGPTPSGSAGNGASRLPTAIATRAPSGATASVDDATWSLAARVTTTSYTADSTDAFRAALARAGIAVVPDDSSDPATARPEVALTGPPSPVELLDFQAHALAVGAWGGATWSGAELDTLVPLPADSGSPTLAELLDGYVGAADTPGGAFARALMAGQDLHDPATVRFPAVVLFLFVSDLATDGGTKPASAGSAAPSSDTGPSPSPTAALRFVPLAGGPIVAAQAGDLSLICAGPDGWIDAVVQRIVSALTAAIGQTVAGAIVVTIFGWLIHTVAALAKAAIDALVGPVLGLIRSIAVLASGIAEQVASLLPYAVHVTVSGGEGSGLRYDQFTLGGDPQFGAYDVAVSGGDLPAWPQALKTCAQAAGIALPDFTTKGARTTFGPIIVSYDPTQLLARGSAARDETVTDATGHATWPFVVGEDPGQGKGTVTYQADTMPVAVHRKELDEIRAALTKALLGALPSILLPYVDALLQPILDTIQAKVNDVLDARGDATVYLAYHLPTPPSPSPSAGPSASGGCATTLPAGTYQGQLTAKSTTIIPPGQIDLGEHGGENDAGSGPLTAAVAADGSISGTFSLTMHNHFEAQGISQGTEDTTIAETGTIGGGLCALTLQFQEETTTACQASGYGTCGPVGRAIDLSGLVPALPLGPPSVSGATLTWSKSYESSFDAGFGGLGGEVQSTTTVTLTGR